MSSCRSGRPRRSSGSSGRWGRGASSGQWGRGAPPWTSEGVRQLTIEGADTVLDSITALDLRGYATLDASFGPGAHLVHGPNAAGKTSLLEAIALLGWGRSHRTNADGELIRWGRELARVEGRVGDDVLEVAVTRSGADGSGGRKRVRINGLGRRASGLGQYLRVVLFAPEEMLLVIGSPSLRRAAIDTLATAHFPAYADDLADVRPHAPAAQQPVAGDPGGDRDPRPAAVLGRQLPRHRRSGRRGAAPAPRAHGRAARGRPRRDRAGGSGGRWDDPALRDQCPDARRRDAARCPRPAADRYRRQGDLERLDRDRAASRRHRLRPGRPRSRRVRLAWTAADGDPRLQARRARPPVRARRPAAAAVARRRVQRARSAPPGAPRAPHRGAAAGVRDDDDARRPRPGAARGRTGLGSQRRRGRRRPDAATISPLGDRGAARAGPIG